MNAAAFVRHSVTLRRDFAEIPPVSVDRHKVLQMLTNVLRNAKYALEDSTAHPKLVEVGIRANDSGFAVVTVLDNGVGIPAENLTRIFAHGFTTRAEGHGFGLHSAALAAQEMGGQITASSNGPGTGALFTLTLPLAVNKSLATNGAAPHLDNKETECRKI